MTRAPSTTSIHFAACDAPAARRATWDEFRAALRARGVDADASPRARALARRAHADMAGADPARALEEALAYVAASREPRPRASAARPASPPRLEGRAEGRAEGAPHQGGDLDAVRRRLD